MADVVLCRDCAHSHRPLTNLFTLGSSAYAWVCRRNPVPELKEVDPVIGVRKTKAHYESCAKSRMSRYTKDVREDHCGPEGKFWQPRNSRDFFIMLKRI
jgi:hypothetical protein